MPQKYNTGGNTSSVGQQPTDYQISKYVIYEATRNKPFSQLGGSEIIKKHMGKTLKMVHEYPILHEANINDQGIDADGVTMVFDKWYAWDSAGVRTEHATKELAEASADMVRIQSGEGNMYGSSKDFNTQMGALPLLSEEGGVVNGVGTKRTVIEATVQRYGYHITYTKSAVDLDWDNSLILKQISRVSEAYAEVRETVLRLELLTAGLSNAVYTGHALQMSEIDETCILTFNDLRAMGLSLDEVDCPADTKMVVGSVKIGTVTAPASRFVYVPYALRPTLEDMVDVHGKPVWHDVSEYTDGITDKSFDKNAVGMYPAEGEGGRIGNFRFIFINTMSIWEGAGASATDGVDANADGIEDAGESMNTTGGNYDVFPLLFVGSESFRSISLHGNDSVTTAHTPPSRIVGVDTYADKGQIAIDWYQGVIITRPERIRVILTACKR